jgi:hypothetical protein
MTKKPLIKNNITLSSKPSCMARYFGNPLVTIKKPKMALDVTFGLLLVGS